MADYKGADVDIVEFLRARLDEDEAWALGASSEYGRAATSGERWHWQDSDTDEDIKPDPALQGEYMDEENALGLRSVELYPYGSIPGEGPHMILNHVQEIEPAVAGHIARHDPARVLREVEAKRRIVGLAGPIVEAVPEDDWGETMHETAMAEALRPVLRLLALPYADHPDYRQEWKP